MRFRTKPRYSLSNSPLEFFITRRRAVADLFSIDEQSVGNAPLGGGGAVKGIDAGKDYLLTELGGGQPGPFIGQVLGRTPPVFQAGYTYSTGYLRRLLLVLCPLRGFGVSIK